MGEGPQAPQNALGLLEQFVQQLPRERSTGTVHVTHIPLNSPFGWKIDA